MKYAFMSFSTPKLTFTEMIEAAARFGYDGIEPRIDSGHAHGVEVAAARDARRAFRVEAGEVGIAIACVATSLRYADPDETEQAVDDTRDRIDLAADLGAPAVRVFGGQFPDSLPRDEAVARVAGALGRVAEHAAERDVTLCMETHDAWCDPAHVAAVVQAVNHPAVAVNWDVMHPVRIAGATMEHAFNTLKPWIRHMHVHDALTDVDLCPIGKGRYDHRTAIRLVQGMDYQGYISGEWIEWDEPYEVHLPREVATLRGYESKT